MTRVTVVVRCEQMGNKGRRAASARLPVFAANPSLQLQRSPEPFFAQACLRPAPATATGSVLATPCARSALRICVAVMVAVVIYDGLTGRQLAPMNLAAVLH